MLHKTRCKFYVSARTVSSTQPFDGQATIFSATVKLNAAYSPDPSTENYAFWNATPSGTATIYLHGEESHNDAYKPGSFWYIDIWESENGAWKIHKDNLHELDCGQMNIELRNNPSAFLGGDVIALRITNQNAWSIFGLDKRYCIEFIPATK